MAQKVPSQSNAYSDPLPISPSLEETVSNLKGGSALLDSRIVLLTLVAIVVAVGSTLCAKVLLLLINAVTNLCFYGALSFSPANPSQNHLGWWVILIPAVGGIVVGWMARYGSKAIRGHGIPEAMEQVLTNKSRIPPRLTFLKPTSSAIAIGSGGPFGAEGPIIATGGALGSLIGQMLHTTAIERKTLLAAGAASGMTAIFGSPIAAVVLAIELLLFELRPRTIIPVASACAIAAGIRHLFLDPGPAFPMPSVAAPGARALFAYIGLGLVIGLIAIGVTKMVYWIEDQFERLPIHWMWWPALGGLAVGFIGCFWPKTLGVGYGNITDALTGAGTGVALITLALAKLASWSISLGSGTSGGTLAPLLTIGGSLGAAIGGLIAVTFPFLGVDPRLAALVGMAAMFTGASRALLTSIVFAFETTQQPTSLMPLLGGCVAAYLLSCLLMKNTIMTEKIARRGIRVPSEFAPDHLGQISVGSVAKKSVVTVSAESSLLEVRNWLKSHGRDSEHQGFPVLDSQGHLLGVVTRRNLLDPAIPEDRRIQDILARRVVTIAENKSLRDAADQMVRERVGRLPVLDAGGQLVGIVTRSDLLAAHHPRLEEAEQFERSINLSDTLKILVKKS